MVIYRPADLILDGIQGLSLSPKLFAGDGHAADALGAAFQQAVHVALTGGTDNHEVVRAVPGRHAHAADIVFEASRSDFRGDGAHRLGIDVPEILCRRQRHVMFKIFTGLVVFEGTYGTLFADSLPPGPSPAPGVIMLQILQDFFHIELFIHIELHFCASVIGSPGGGCRLSEQLGGVLPVLPVGQGLAG
jgi:hypothetical protein